MLKRVLISTLALMISCTAYAYPPVGTSTSNIQPNRWTSQFEAAKVRANQLGLPMLVAMMSTGCSHCANWDARVLSSSTWTTFLNEYPMILVMLDFNSNGTAYNNYKRQYFGATASLLFPTISLHAPSGMKLGHFLAKGTAADPGQHTRNILAFTRDYYNAPGSVGFQQSTMTVSEADGALAIAVARSGGSSGATVLNYAVVNGTAVSGTHFSGAMNGTVNWGDNDGATKFIPITLINDGRWTAPEQRSFSVTLSKASSDATLETSSLVVTINEAEPYAPGVVGFAASSATVIEGNDYSGTLIRSGGAVGAAKVALSVPPGYTVTPDEVEWSDTDSDDKAFVVSGIVATPEYDSRTIEVTLTKISGEATLGEDVLEIDILDQIVTESFEDYIDGKPLYEGLSYSGGLWFYNEDDGLRSAPLGGGESSTLSWTAPASGRLTFVWGRQGADAGSIELELDQDSYPLGYPIATNTLVLAHGESFDLVVDNPIMLELGIGELLMPVEENTNDLYVTFEILGWEALNPVSASGGTLNGDKLQIDFIRQDHSLADLTWNSGSGNPDDTGLELLAGSAASALVYVATPGGNLINGVDEGVVDLDDAQGWIFWQVNSTLTADYGDPITASGPVWSFAVIDLPLFTEDAPDDGSIQNAYLRTGASIQVPAFSATPVTYSATGLPAGLSINPTTGEITGTARTTGTYNVRVMASNSEGSVELPFVIRTQNLPDYVAKANFTGGVFASTDAESPDYTTPVRGTITVKATKTGKVSAKVIREGKALSLKGQWITGSPDGVFSTTLVGKGGETLALAVGPNGILTGALNGQQLLARAFQKGQGQSKVGYYTTLYESEILHVNSGAINNQPGGFSYLTLNVSKAGKAKYAGILADGTKMSGSTSLLLLSGDEMQGLGYNSSGGAEYAAVPIFAPLYGKRGSAALLAWIDPANDLWADSTYWNYPGRSLRLTDDGFAATLQDLGASSPFSVSAVYAGGVYNKAITLSPYFSGAYLVMEDAFSAGYYELPTIAQGRGFTIDRKNEYKAKLTVKPATGLFNGNFNLVDPATNRGKKYKFKGVVVPDLGLGGGVYLVPDTTTGSYRLKRSYMIVIAGPAS